MAHNCHLLDFQEYNAYVTSSIMAAFLDTVSVSYRSRTLPLPLANVVDILTPARRKVRIENMKMVQFLFKLY